jgi:hypothetical protein
MLPASWVQDHRGGPPWEKTTAGRKGQREGALDQVTPVTWHSYGWWFGPLKFKGWGVDWNQHCQGWRWHSLG